MKITLIYILILLSLSARGQVSFWNDTIKINEVLIIRKKANPYPTGYKKDVIDSSILKFYSHGTLADILSENSKIFIKSYGMGGTATPSFRGTGASHTQLAWNGVNINHPMLGQSDLSLLPAGLMDDIEVYFGGASMAMNSGGIGGIINLKTKPVWKKETVISMNPGIGSFGQYTGLIKVKTGNIHFQTVTKAFLQSSENDFVFLNDVSSSKPVLETRKNSQILQQGFIQELYYRREKNIASARIWYQAANRNLPSSMLAQQVNSNEKQFDQSLRTMLNFEGYKGRYNYFFTGVSILNRLNYTNSLASIDSRNLTETILLKAGVENQIDDYTKFKIVLNDELSVVKTNNYENNSTRNTSTLTASAERNNNGRFGASILLREIFDNNVLLIPDFSAGIQFRLIDDKDYYLKGNISRNSKIPSMNDLFWFPGGNNELKNEYAFIYELDYEMTQKISSPLILEYDLSLFRNFIKDMILWHPGEFIYWTVDNIESVSSLGVESSLSLAYTLHDFSAKLNAGYSFTNATNISSQDVNGISIGNQLMYVPQNQANASLRLNYNKFYSFWSANFTGLRYTTIDNSRYLPEYILNNLSTGIRMYLKGNLMDFNFTINNLFNVDYQTLAYYPLPGRSFSFKILIQIVK